MPPTMEMPETLEDVEFESIDDMESTAADEADAEDARHTDDPRANEHGVYTEGVEVLEIGFPKSHKTACSIHVVQALDGQWQAAYDLSWSEGGSASLPSLDDHKHGTRKEAVIDQLNRIGDYIAGEIKRDPSHKAKLEKIGRVVAKYLDAAMEWPDDQQPVAAEQQPAEESKPQQSDAVADYEQRVNEASQAFTRAALYRAKAEAEAKYAKAQEKSALEELQKIVDRGPEHYPLFDGNDKPAGSAPPATTEAATEPDDESWKEVEIGELDIPEGIVNKLLEAEIANVGDLAIWSTEKSLTDIDGIGQAKADKIDAALEKFWAERKVHLS